MRADALTRRRRTSRYTCGWARAAVWCAQTRPQPLQVSRRAPFHSLAHHSTRFFPSVPLPPPTEPYVCPHVRARSWMADNISGDDAAAVLADNEAKRAARPDKVPSMRRLLTRLSTTRFASQAQLAALQWHCRPQQRRRCLQSSRRRGVAWCWRVCSARVLVAPGGGLWAVPDSVHILVCVRLVLGFKTGRT